MVGIEPRGKGNLVVTSGKFVFLGSFPYQDEPICFDVASKPADLVLDISTPDASCSLDKAGSDAILEGQNVTAYVIATKSACHTSKVAPSSSLAGCSKKGKALLGVCLTDAPDNHIISERQLAHSENLSDQTLSSSLPSLADQCIVDPPAFHGQADTSMQDVPTSSEAGGKGGKFGRKRKKKSSRPCSPPIQPEAVSISLNHSAGGKNFDFSVDEFASAASAFGLKINGDPEELLSQF